MDRESSGYLQWGRGEASNSSKRADQGGRTYSTSSGNSGSSGSRSQDQPTLRSLPAHEGYAIPPKSHTGSSTMSNGQRRSSLNLGRYHINETYKERSSATSSPKQESKPSSPANKGNRSHTSIPRSQYTHTKSSVRRDSESWALNQETRLKLMNVPRIYWTKDVYLAMSKYGSVVRIEMRTGSHSNDAIVTFQPSLSVLPKQPLNIGSAHVSFGKHFGKPPTVVSPVNPRKKYFEINVFFARSLDFGTRTDHTESINMHTVKAMGRVQMMLNLKRKEIDIQFPLNIENGVTNFRFRMPIHILPNIYRVVEDTGQVALIIPFDSPPQFFVQKKPTKGREDSSFSRNDPRWIDWSTWYRETDVVDSLARKQMMFKPLMNHKESAIIDIGQWTVYRLCFDRSVLAGPKFSEFCEALADHGVMIQDLDRWEWKSKVTSKMSELLQEEISGTHPHLYHTSKQSTFDDLLVSQIHLPFNVRYQLEVCLSNGYIKEQNINQEFLEKLFSTPRAVGILEKVAEKQHVYFNPMEIFSIDIRTRSDAERKVPSYCILQRSANVTPTMIYVASPVMEISNRITRKYIADADRFIRVRFSDEKTEGLLRSARDDTTNALFDRVSRAMKHGIIVAGRFYEFLAFGNSQFREHGAYFYAPTTSKSADDIRLSLGQFDHIKTVAKFGARLGQCFSTTRAMRVSVQIQQIPDITRNGYTFTDGVGKLSPFLAQMAAEELGLPNAFESPPSLYQFRLGGCKGVLAVDPKLTRQEVHIRPSQQKFQAEFTGLEIIRCSTFATPFLNRQVIMVLSALGVPDGVFAKKQQEMVNTYEQAMRDETIAVQKLQQHIDMNQTSITMASMVLDGFMKTQEPFMMSLLMLWRSFTVKNLKEKARVAVDAGAFVLGCVDETATLRGHFNNLQKLDATNEQKLEALPEIFLQVDDTNKKGHYRIIEGVCVLARNPSLHAGDVRVVRAVDVPALHHHKNVVVLPQTGDRDLANMCSGGDLDGDDYMILWDSTLIPKTINAAPMDFTPEQPIEKDNPITVSDIADFFVTFMRNDSLGRIAHAHLAQADWEAEGVQSDTCLELAKLHSQAVDYPKSGVPAVMNNEMRPKRWPHFMEKKHIPSHQIYPSKKVLGQLYDQVQLVDFKPQWENAFDKRILNAFDLNEPLLSQAADIKITYDESLKRLMAKHGICNEFEAWSVFVLAHNKKSSDYKFAEEFGRAIDALKTHFRNVCCAAAGASSSSDWSQLGPFVAAMYATTAREAEAALQECRATELIGGQEVPIRKMDAEHMPLISFPWLFVRELGKIATGCTTPLLQSHVQKTDQHPHRPRKQVNHGQAITRAETSIVETDAGITRYGELLALDLGPSRFTTTDGQPSTPEFNKIQQATAGNGPPESSLSSPKPNPLSFISFPAVAEPHNWRRKYSDESTKTHFQTRKLLQAHSHLVLTSGDDTIQATRTMRDAGSTNKADMSFEINIDYNKPTMLDKLQQLGERK